MELREEAVKKGAPRLYEELERVDKATAGKVHPNDTIRIIRALEFYRGTGRPISEFRQAHGFSRSSYRVLKLAIDAERRELYRRIEARVDQMIERGLIEEVKLLFSLGYGRSLKPMQSIGYRQIGDYLCGDLGLNQAIEFIKRDSRHYAKRQWTWFRAERDVCWLTGRMPELEAFKRVKNFLKV
jgi:tRNA dimethylallyltransferase